MAILSLYESNLDAKSIFESRIEVHLMTRNCKRNSLQLLHYFPQATVHNDTPCQSGDFHYFKNTVEVRGSESDYKQKYINALKHFLAFSDRMLVMVLEDDVVPIYSISTTIRHLVINTMAFFSNDLDNFDCSKRGFLLRTGSDGNKSLCRIYSKETLKKQIECFEELPDAIDIMINYCQEKLDIPQKRFLLFNHIGFRSLLGHDIV
jgi:hypothetical protein